MKKNSFINYLTTWTNIVVIFLFLIAIMFKIPMWLFLCCLSAITTTSVIGTFFITMPKINKENYKQVIYDDLVLHVFPLFIVLSLFGLLRTRTFGSPKFLLSFITFFIFTMMYGVFVGFENNYSTPTDTICSISFLIYATFVLSYGIYRNII